MQQTPSRSAKAEEKKDDRSVPFNSPNNTSMSPAWQCRGRHVMFDAPRVMGILNVTPDSFSDGGCYTDVGRAIEHALAMAEAGADILDVGGESTRPGAQAIDETEELRRVLPVIRGLAKVITIPISIDTRHAHVARQAIEAGASIVNDVAPFNGDLALATVVRETGAGLVLTHTRGTPQDMMTKTLYADVVATVETELHHALAFAMDHGIAREACVIDPGIGFAKGTEQNLYVLAAVKRLTALAPVLIGASRKRFIGEICTVPDATKRLGGSLCVAVWSVLQGASIVRVHDVKETKDSLAMAMALKTASISEKKAC
jgi:dihydropteroate synthase